MVWEGDVSYFCIDINQHCSKSLWFLSSYKSLREGRPKMLKDFQMLDDYQILRSAVPVCLLFQALQQRPSASNCDMLLWSQPQPHGFRGRSMRCLLPEIVEGCLWENHSGLLLGIHCHKRPIKSSFSFGQCNKFSKVKIPQNTSSFYNVIAIVYLEWWVDSSCRIFDSNLFSGVLRRKSRCSKFL